MHYQHHQPGCVYHLEQQMWKKFTYDWKFIISNGSTYLKYILRSEFRTTLLMAEGLALFWTKNWIRILQKKQFRSVTPGWLRSLFSPKQVCSQNLAVWTSSETEVLQAAFGKSMKIKYILRINSRWKCSTLILPRKARIHELKLKIWNSDKTYKTGRFVSG